MFAIAQRSTGLPPLCLTITLYRARQQPQAGCRKRTALPTIAGNYLQGHTPMSHRHYDQLITARWIITVEQDGVILDNHSLAISDGRIVAILSPAEVAGVRPGDVITLGKKAKDMALIAEAQSLPERDVPGLSDNTCAAPMSNA